MPANDAEDDAPADAELSSGGAGAGQATLGEQGLEEQSPTEQASARPEASDTVAWLSRNWVRLASVALIVGGLWQKELVQANSWFHQDDFYLLDLSLRSKLDWHLLGGTYAGHFMPGSLALTWVLVRVSLYSWTLTSAVNLALLAAACVALLRLLQTMFGRQPAILIPLAAYAFCPIAVPGLSFWSTTINWVPTQLVIFMAANAHLSYVRNRRFRDAAIAAAWVALGLLFDEADVFIPLLLFGITSAFLMPGNWLSAAIAALREYWRAWVTYVLLTAAYAAVLLQRLETGARGHGEPVRFSAVLTFIGTLLRVGFVPSALGGPWRWLSDGPQAFALQVGWLTPLSLLVAALVIAASLICRRRAWRAWAILAGWVLLTAVVPLVLGRTGVTNPAFLGTDLHYLADSMPVLAICLGLAFWPMQGEEGAYRASFPRQPRQLATAGLLAAFLAGSLYSSSSYVGSTSGAPDASYIATARIALAEAPRRAVIWSQPVPGYVQTAQYYGKYGYTSIIDGLMASPSRRLDFTTTPAGVYSNLLVFDGIGRLWGVLLEGRSLRPPAKSRGCWWVGAEPEHVRLGPRMYFWPWEISISYRGPASTMAVEYSGEWHAEHLPAGAGVLWVPAPGSGSEVQLDLISGGPRVCVSALRIGIPEASVYTRPIPAESVPG